MSTEKKKCCEGCKNGNPGQNGSCRAKLMAEQLKKQEVLTNEKN